MARYKLDNYITLQVPTEDYSTGDLVITEGDNVYFWGSVKEVKSSAVEATGIARTYTESRLRDQQIIEITARYRDTEDVAVGGELTFDDFDGTFTVFDKYDKDFKHYVVIMAQRTQ